MFSFRPQMCPSGQDRWVRANLARIDPNLLGLSAAMLNYLRQTRLA